MRRLGSVRRFNQLGTPAPGRQVQRQGTQGAPQPRPPAQGPAAGQPAQAQATQGGDIPLPEGRTITIPEPGDAVAAGSAPVLPNQPGQLLADVKESPAVAYWRQHGMMPNFFSLQVMASRRQLELQLGRAPTAREIAQSLSQRDMSTDASQSPTI